MMPSTSLQSRINAFEALGETSSSSTPPPPRTAVRQSPKAQNPLETPISPTVLSFSPIEPFTPPKAASASPSPSPPNLGRKTSLIDLKDWVVDDGPTPHRQNGDWNGNNIGRYKQYQRHPRNNRSGRSPARSKSSAPLINLESPPRSMADTAPPIPPRRPSYTSLKSASSIGSANSNTSSTNGSGATLLPPSRSDSLTVEHTYPPLSKLNTDGSRKGPGHAPASSISSFHSVSLSSDGGTTDIGTPGSVTNFIATSPMDREPSGGGDIDSLDESFENVSTSSAISSSNHPSLAFDWDKAVSKKKSAPPLPQRPSSKSSPTISPPASSSPTPRSIPLSPPLRPTSSASSSATARRAPPPPPPLASAAHLRNGGSGPPSSRNSLTSATASDRSSIFSTTSRTSISSRASTQVTSKHSSLSRPTPVPAAAVKRYETVFMGNLLQKRKAEKAKATSKPTLLAPPGTRKSRQAAGWRGLSVDLITNPEDHPLTTSEQDKDIGGEDESEDVGADERIDGYIVKLVWSASKLEKSKLRDIWNECDPVHQGSLDRDSFVKGMWRIDEELRRAQLSRQTSTGSSYRVRITPKPPSTKLILR